MKREKRFQFGPGAMVTAAFIGPGTITTCSLAGANFGYTLLWALLFSTLATIVLQEMSARLGIVSGLGLGEALRRYFCHPLQRVFVFLLVIGAILIGNAAFQTGNILGAALGLNALSGKQEGLTIYILLVAGFAFWLLFRGNYWLIEKVLIGLVLMMSGSFLCTALLVAPDIRLILKGSFWPTLPFRSLLTVTGLIGTTVVPYNLFLHSSAVIKKWHGPENLPAARLDIILAVIVGGLISMSIVITSAAAFAGSDQVLKSGADLARQLEPLLGKMSRIFIGIGLFAAGISSAVTAPLAAAFAIGGIFGWKGELRSWRFRLVWMRVLLAGLFFALSGLNPLETILFAQAMNGTLLPLIAFFLLKVMNSKELMGAYRNHFWLNLFALPIIFITLLISLRTLGKVFKILP